MPVPPSRPSADAPPPPRPRLLAAELGAGAALICLFAPIAFRLLDMPGTEPVYRPYHLALLAFTCLSALGALVLLVRPPRVGPTGARPRRPVGIALFLLLSAFVGFVLTMPYFINFG